MANCSDCTKLRPLTKPDDACKKIAEKIEDVRIYCCDELTETISASPLGDCSVGYISDLVNPDPVGNPDPIKAVDVINPDDIDELNTYTLDRATDTGEDTYSITFGLRIFDPDQECTYKSLKGQDICVIYRITNRDGDYVWRRVTGTVSNIDGGLKAGYNITVDIINGDEEELPLFVNFSTALATTTALDLLTEF